MTTKVYDPSVDTGCKLHPLCLRCPEPTCIEDLSYGANRRRRRGTVARNRRVAAFYYDLGMSVDELCSMFSLTKRHIYRILREERQGAARH
jgi:hypothetical protein